MRVVLHKYINLSDALGKHKWFEDTKWVIRGRKSKDRQHNGQTKMNMDKQWYSKQLAEKEIMSHLNPSKIRGKLIKGKQLLFH